MSLTRIQRAFISDKLMDSANVVLAGLVIGQLIADTLPLVLIFLGLVVYLGGWLISVWIWKGVRQR